MIDRRSKKKVFVIFKESEDDRVSPKKFLRYGFSHVFIWMTYDTKTHGNTHKPYLQCDPLFSNLSLTRFSMSERDLIKSLNKPGYTVLKLIVEEGTTDFYQMGLKLFTCVSIIKYILGIKCFAITPYQLYKRLLKMEGKQGIVSVKQIN